MKVIKKALAVMVGIETYIPGAALVLAAILVTTISVTRYAFSWAFFGLEEITVVVALYAYYFGSIVATREKVQLRIDILDQIPLPSLVRRIMDLTWLLFGIGIFGVLTYISVVYALWTIERGLDVAPLGWPRVIMVVPLVAAFSLMAVHTLIQFVQGLTERRK